MSTLTPAMLHSGFPTIMRGEPAAPIFAIGCPRLAKMMPGAALVVVRESHSHALDSIGTVREVLARLPTEL